MTSNNKTSYVLHEWTSVMNNRTIFWKELILLTFLRQNYYHWIKHIIFKRSSSKYNEVSHYHISYKETSCVLKYFPRLAANAIWTQAAKKKKRQRARVRSQGQIRGRKAPGFGLATFGWTMMTSIVQQGSSLDWSPTSLNLHYNPYLPTPPLGQDMTQGQFLSGV